MIDPQAVTTAPPAKPSENHPPRSRRAPVRSGWRGREMDGFMVAAGHDGPAGRTPLSPEQREAAAAIREFLADEQRRTFSLHGAAGVGKTHLLGRLAQSKLAPWVCAPTGKSAAILRERFDVPAQTIHSLFHRLKAETQRAYGRRDLEFSHRRRDGSLAGRVVLIDDSSMATAQLRDDLLATSARIIAFGDERQLPPANGEQGFTRPDFTLRQIHRQAADSPIIRQHAVRGGGDYAPDGPDCYQRGEFALNPSV
jgi:hypothetical protein